MRRPTFWRLAGRSGPSPTHRPGWVHGGLAALLGLTLLLAGPAPVGAQATRTWVSGVGDDANICNRTAPCKTFAGAISKTAPGGEINVLDPGGFGAVTITKAVSIVAEGATAGIVAAVTNGVIVNAGANDVVVLRGLDLDGVGNGLNGIRYLAGKALFVENTTIGGFNGSPGHGIDVAKTAEGELFVTNTQIRNNAGAGIRVSSTSGAVRATLDGVSLENNGNGLDARDRARVTMRDSVASGNAGHGMLVQSTAGSELNVESSVSSGNNIGIQADGNAQSIVRIANTVVTGNNVGVTTTAGGQILSFGNNMIFGNASNGAPTGTIPLQ